MRYWVRGLSELQGQTLSGHPSIRSLALVLGNSGDKIVGNMGGAKDNLRTH